MSTMFSSKPIMQECHRIWLKVALCVTISSASGCIFASSIAEQYASLMRMACARSVSIVGSAVGIYLPFLVSVIILINSKPRLVYLIIAAYIFNTTASACTLQYTYGNAGWLVRILMLLPQLFGSFGLLYLSIQKLLDSVCKERIVYILLAMAILGLINHCFLSPFLANVINSYDTTGRYATYVGLDWRL